MSDYKAKQMQNMPTPPAYARSPRMPLHRRHTISSGASPKKKKPSSDRESRSCRRATTSSRSCLKI